MSDKKNENNLIKLDERAVDLHNQIESNDSLRKRKEHEIAFISSIFHYGEELQKEFECFTPLEDGTIVKGELLITDERIMFFHDDEGEFQFISFEYFELDEFYQSYQRKNRSVGSLHAVMNGEHYIYTGFMRFGLSIWVEYVNNKIVEY